MKTGMCSSSLLHMWYTCTQKLMVTKIMNLGLIQESRKFSCVKNFNVYGIHSFTVSKFLVVPGRSILKKAFLNSLSAALGSDDPLADDTLPP